MLLIGTDTYTSTMSDTGPGCVVLLVDSGVDEASVPAALCESVPASPHAATTSQPKKH